MANHRVLPSGLTWSADFAFFKGRKVCFLNFVVTSEFFRRQSSLGDHGLNPSNTYAKFFRRLFSCKPFHRSILCMSKLFVNEHSF